MKVHRIPVGKFLRLPALLTVFVLGCSGAVSMANLTRSPYVQRPTTSSVTIVWETDVPAICSVEYGPTPEMGQEKRETSQQTHHAMELTGLRPGAEYYYRVLAEGAPLTRRTIFKTNKDESDPDFSFVIFGDSGTGNEKQEKVAAQMLRVDPDFGLHTGDVVYPAGAVEDYNAKYFRPYKNIIASVCFYPTLGNHDYRTAAGRPYLDMFILPANNPAESEKYYSFDYANAHFVCLDSNLQIGGNEEKKQLEWLRKDLASTRKQWKFAFMHHPPYSYSYHGSSIEFRSRYCPVFEEHSVDMVFSGHDHNYQRMNHISEFTSGGNGVIYIVTGGGGAGLYDVERGEWTAFAKKAHHFVFIKIRGDTLTLSAIDDKGNVFDEATFMSRP